MSTLIIKCKSIDPCSGDKLEIFKPTPISKQIIISTTENDATSDVVINKDDAKKIIEHLTNLID